MSNLETVCKALSLIESLERMATNSYDRREYRKAIQHLKNAYDPSISCDQDEVSGYRLFEAYDGCMVVKTGAYCGRDMYLVSIRKGECKWCQDHTYARHYSLETASKHIEALRKGEIA